MSNLNFKLVANDDNTKYVMVREDTGEIIGETTFFNSDVCSGSFKTKKQKEYADNHKNEFNQEVLTFKAYSQYSMSNDIANMDILKSKPTKYEMLFLFLFYHSLAQNTNVVKITKNKYMDIESLMNIFDIKQRQVYDTLKSLKEKDIIRIVKVKGKNRIYLNPYIHHKGTFITVEVQEMFKNSKWNTFRKKLESRDK